MLGNSNGSWKITFKTNDYTKITNGHLLFNVGSWYTYAYRKKILWWNSKSFFNNVEYGTDKLKNEVVPISFATRHEKPPKALFFSYSEIGVSIGGEPKELKAFAVHQGGFSVTVSSYDGNERNFSWIAVW